MTSPITMVQVRCPICGQASWVMDSLVRGSEMSGEPEQTFPERTYTCRECSYEGTGFLLLQAAPSTFLVQPHELYPMGRKAFRHWLEILKEQFPNHPRLEDVGREFQPNLPTVYQQAAAALVVLAFILDPRDPEEKLYGRFASKLDTVCLSLVFEHHVRREYGFPKGDILERLEEHIDGEEVSILAEGTIQRMVIPVFGRARELADRRPMVQDWHKDFLFGFGIEVLNRFGKQEVFPPMPDPDDWQYATSSDLAPSDSEHLEINILPERLL